MISLLVIAPVILAAPFAAAFYFSRAAKLTRRASLAWTGLEQSARILLEDGHLSPRVGDMVEFLVLQVGSGIFCGLFLVTVLFGRSAKSQKAKSTTIFDEMNEEQSDRFIRFIAHALFYDSLCSPIVGTIMRRFLFWLGDTVKDKRAPISRYEVAPAVRVAARMAHV